MKILFLINSNLVHLNANTRSILNLFFSNKDRVHYLAVKSSRVQNRYDTKNIFYYEDFLKNNSLFIYRFLKKYDFLITNLLRLILGPISSFSDFFLYKIFIKNFKNEFDYILIPLMPIDIYLAIKDSVDTEKILPILFDQISNNVFAGSRYPFKTRLINKAVLFEKNLVKSSKLIFYTDGLNDDFLTKYPNHKHKLIKIYTPLFIKQDNHVRNKNIIIGNTYRVIYAGTFYKILRPIEDLLDFLRVLGDYLVLIGKSLEADIYTSHVKNFNQDHLNVYSRIYGYLNSEELSSKINESDIIVAMGNNYLDQSPSKIIEFIGYNKPLIYLYYLDDDMLLDKLRYDNASIALKINEIDYELLLRFLTYLGNRDYDQLSFLIDYSPESVMESIIKTINDYEDK